MSNDAGAPTQENEKKQELTRRWGKPLIDAGWVAFPYVILERQHALGLDATDINIILHIAKHWFKAEQLPHPSKGSIAQAMRMTPRAIQKRLASLEAAGFLKRIERRDPKGGKGNLSSEYDLKGLIEKATPFAEEALQQREEKREADKARVRRKRPLIKPSGESQ